MSAGDEQSGEKGLDDAVREFAEKLQRAYREPDRTKIPIRDPLIETWHRHSIALRSVAEFAFEIGVETDIVDRFASIAAAFDGLTMGLHPPLFKPNSPGGGRKNDQSDIWAVRACVVAALECYMRSGLANEGAAHLIAEKVDSDETYRHLLNIARSGSTLESAMLNWHKLLKAGAAGTGIGVKVFQSLIEEINLNAKGSSGEPAKEQYGEWGLEYLRKAATYAAILIPKRDGNPPVIFKRPRETRESVPKPGPRGSKANNKRRKR